MAKKKLRQSPHRVRKTPLNVTRSTGLLRTGNTLRNGRMRYLDFDAYGEY